MHTIETWRVWLARPLMVLLALLALCSTGCVYFEKQTIFVVLVPERDEARVLLVYEGFHVAGQQEADLKRAEKSLAMMFKDRHGFYLGHPLFEVSLQDENMEKKLSEDEKKQEELLRQHISNRMRPALRTEKGSCVAGKRSQSVSRGSSWKVLMG